MTIDINVITQNSNKTLSVINTQSELIAENYTNELINLEYNNSYIVYVQPTINDIGFSEALDVTNSFFTSTISYIWIVLLLFFGFYFIRSLRNYVK